jgi:hypothetical protein
MLSTCWQPNFFRPKFRVGGVDISNNLSNFNVGAVFHNSAIGLPLP